jgi:hypothetical protein
MCKKRLLNLILPLNEPDLLSNDLVSTLVATSMALDEVFDSLILYFAVAWIMPVAMFGF